jgi:hypothetical protein
MQRNCCAFSGGASAKFRTRDYADLELRRQWPQGRTPPELIKALTCMGTARAATFGDFHQQ